MTSSNKKNIGVFCLLKYKNNILLVKKNYGNKKWFLPGGSVKDNESLQSALKREVREETGQLIKKSKLKYIGVSFYKKENSVGFIFMYSLEKITKFVFDKDEISEVELFDIDKLNIDISKMTKVKINFVLKNINSNFNNLILH